MKYYVFFKNSTTKAPITGLTLTWAYLVKGADGTAYTPQPAFTELAGGYYAFSISPNQDLLGRIDGGAALAPQDRYAEVTLTAADAYLDAAVSSRSTFAGGAVDSVTAPVTLTAAYDPAKTAASQASVDAIPTAPLLANDARLNHLDADISSRSTFAGGAVASVTAPVTLAPAYDAAKSAASQASVDAIPTNPLLTTDARLNHLDADVSSRLAAAGYTAPANATVGAILDALSDPDTGLSALLYAVGTRLAAAGYTAPDNAGIAALLGRVQGELPMLAQIVAGVLGAAAADNDAEGTIGHSINHPAVPVVVPLFTGGVTAVTLTRGKVLHVKAGNTYRLPFSLGFDCTGWAAVFGAKKDKRQEEYDMSLRDAVFTNEATGSGYVDLTAEDLASVGVYYAELQLRNEGQRTTPEEYTINVHTSVIN